MTAQIRLVSNSARIRNAVREALAPAPVLARGASSSTKPTRADAVITTGRLSSSGEYLAASLGTPWVFVLPEAADYLTGWLARRHEPGATAPVLVGIDIGDHAQLAKAGLNADHDKEVEL